MLVYFLNMLVDKTTQHSTATGSFSSTQPHKSHTKSAKVQQCVHIVCHYMNTQYTHLSNPTKSIKLHVIRCVWMGVSVRIERPHIVPLVNVMHIIIAYIII